MNYNIFLYVGGGAPTERPSFTWHSIT